MIGKKKVADFKYFSKVLGMLHWYIDNTLNIEIELSKLRTF